MARNGNELHGRMTVLAKVFGAPEPGLSGESQLAIRSFLQEAEASLMDLGTDGAVPTILFSMPGPTSQSVAEALIWRAVARCYPKQTLSSLDKMEVQVKILASPEPPTAAAVVNWLRVAPVALAVWLPAIAAFGTGIYLSARASVVLSNPTQTSGGTPAQIHVTVQEEHPATDGNGPLIATEWELASQVLRLIHQQHDRVHGSESGGTSDCTNSGKCSNANTDNNACACATSTNRRRKPSEPVPAVNREPSKERLKADPTLQ